MRTDLTNLMADISVACTLMCCCCLWKSVGESLRCEVDGLGGIRL